MFSAPMIDRYHIPMPRKPSPPRYLIATWLIDEETDDDFDSLCFLVDELPPELSTERRGPDADIGDLHLVHRLVHAKVVRGRPAPDHSRQTVLYSREELPSHYAPEPRETNTGPAIAVHGRRERGTVYP